MSPLSQIQQGMLRRNMGLTLVVGLCIRGLRCKSTPPQIQPVQSALMMSAAALVVLLPFQVPPSKSQHLAPMSTSQEQATMDLGTLMTFTYSLQPLEVINQPRKCPASSP